MSLEKVRIARCTSVRRAIERSEIVRWWITACSPP
jgi:hypothetical protein